jgi:hypothetical protein
MSIPETLIHLKGGWSGVNRLWLSPEAPVRMSDATAEVGSVAGGQFLTIAYTWAEEGPQDGLIVFGWQEESGALQAAWVDSWHNQDKLMSCRGHRAAAGRVAVQGTYPAPPGPDWGWEIAVEPDGRDSFRMVMDNITPEGHHARAVEISLSRQR